jgi:predicted phage terminase large subunit-like protein
MTEILENSAEYDEEEVDWAELGRSSLINYAICQKDNYRPGKHHHIIGRELEKVMRGETKRLMIFAPPQHGKSELATQLFPAYYYGFYPKNALIVGGYAQDKADDFGRATKGYMDSEVYSALFPNTSISPLSDSIRRFATTQGGTYFAAGIGGAITGRGANGLILDDPYKNREEADSDSRNELIKDWWKSTFRTRLRGDGFIVIIQTRWNKRDLVQFLLDTEGDNPKYRWKIVNLVAMVEDEEDAANDPLKRKIGQSLWPDVFPPEIMEQMKIDVGSRDWNALYQQRPSDAKGDIYQRAWFRYYKSANCNNSEHTFSRLPEQLDETAQVWDCSFKKTVTSDFVVGLAGARKGANLYLLDRSKKRNDMPGTKRQILEFSNKWPFIMWKGVEDKANGPAVISELQKDLPGLVSMDSVDGKPARWHATAPAVESGNVFLPCCTHWTDDFIEVCASVPSGKYDDDADALAYLILKLLGRRLTGMLDWMKDRVLKMRGQN